MDALEVAGRRRRALRLTGEPLPGPEAVVGHLLAVQAQDLGPALWSVGMRAAGATLAGVASALADGRLLRTHVLRPTWHLVLPADLRWLLDLTAARVHGVNDSWYLRWGLTPEVRARSLVVLAEAVAEGHRTRAALQAVLAADGLSVQGLALGYVLMHAELEQVLASGVPEGAQQTYGPFDERVPAAPPVPRDEALARLGARYVVGRGPVTAKDLQWWAGLSPGDARQALDASGAPREDRWALPPDPGGPVDDLPSAHLLQTYDELVVGVQDTRGVITVGPYARCDHGPVPNAPVLLDGQLAGHWRRTASTREVVVELHLHRPPTRAQRRLLEAEARRYGAFVGLTARVELAPLAPAVPGQPPR